MKPIRFRVFVVQVGDKYAAILAHVLQYIVWQDSKSQTSIQGGTERPDKKYAHQTMIEDFEGICIYYGPSETKADAAGNRLQELIRKRDYDLLHDKWGVDDDEYRRYI